MQSQADQPDVGARFDAGPIATVVRLDEPLDEQRGTLDFLIPQAALWPLSRRHARRGNGAGNGRD
ncbi:hypothetical protein WK91_07580 [Burkholderia cepacia]|nr:hypothetical protein WK91_07580 [Burkholderia cepacia]